jgi:hypothetical protein
MDINEFAELIERSHMSIDEKGKVTFTPRYPKDERRVAEIIAKNQMEHFSFTDLQALSKDFAPVYQARRKLQAKRAEEFSALSPKQIAELSTEQKLDYLDAVFPKWQEPDGLLKACSENEQNIKAALYGIKFPESFWKAEKKSAERYAALIAGQPKLCDAVKNWRQTSLNDKKEAIMQAAEVFEYVYGLAPKIEFFTEEQERAQLQAEGLNKDTHIYAAYQRGGTLYFNEDRLQESYNFFAVSVLLHEGTHLRQNMQSFNDKLVDRIFDCNMRYVAYYDRKKNDKQSAEYMDLYTANPIEVHAHAVQDYMEQRFTEISGIKKVEGAENAVADKIHNKAFAMAKIAQAGLREK